MVCSLYHEPLSKRTRSIFQNRTARTLLVRKKEATGNSQNETGAIDHNEIENQKRNIQKIKIKTEYNVIYVFGSNLVPC